jgi:ABC-type transport system involved in multi-copper enzyme maturation permease subunit
MIFTVANYTLREIIKSKIMILAFIIAFFVLLVSYVASELSYGVPGKVALEFGLGCVSLASLGISMLLGVSLIYNEVDNRTVYMVLARPISRVKFILGKVLGFTGFLSIFITLLAGLIICLYVAYDGPINGLIFLTFFNIFIESLLTLLMIVLFTLFVNQTLAFIFTISLLIGGYTIGSIRELGFQQQNNMLVILSDLYGFIFPDLDRINLRPYVIYEQKIDISILVSSSAYGMIYCLILSFLIVKVFGRKNLD